MRLVPVSLLFLVVAGLSPFLLTAWLREHRGLNITGKVTRKQETVWHSTFENDVMRTVMITVSYFPPGRSWPAEKSIHLPLKRYDELNRGDVVRMRYLLEQDLPPYPLLHSLYRSGFLPIASADGRSVFTGGLDLIPELPLRLVCGVAALLVVLWLWKKSRIPGSGLAMVFCFLLAIAALSFSEIPRPMSALQGAVLTAKASVQNEWTIDQIFASRKSNSSPVPLDQPVQYVALEFVPEGRREPVVAVDNIDARSIPDLKVGQLLEIQYERADPRSARLVAGTRTFWNRNLRGLAIWGAAWLVLGAAAIVIWAIFSRRRHST
jgi:hypothetical protein